MREVELSRCVVPILSMRLKNVLESVISFGFFLAPVQEHAVTQLLGVLGVLQGKTE